LFHLKDRIKAKGKTFEEIASQPIKRRKNPQAAKSEPKADTKKSLPRPASGAAAKGRMASAMEREAFAYRCLALERYIEGFVSGLEIGGIDRRKLSVEAVRAIDALLGICQKTRSERLRATSMKITRNLIRKLGRHIKESSVLTDEYVNAVKENADGKR
jgi:replicative superfamily II helicase